MGHSMNIGYLPDIFGQNAYLPSLFKDFNIDYSILQRGLYNEQLKDGLNFTWKSPDGRDIPSNNIYFGIIFILDMVQENFYQVILTMLKSLYFQYLKN